MGSQHRVFYAADTAAVCDVDQHVRAMNRNSLPTLTGKCDAYDDFRRLLDRQDIDAVVVSTPHHWHTLVTVAACQAGKDVYCEKPLALTIAEDRAIVTAAREHGRIVQTGSQQRSGRLGQLRRIEVGLPKSVF
jgi:predicted dehydrogenase